jgi:hypothetical protein
MGCHHLKAEARLSTGNRREFDHVGQQSFPLQEAAQILRHCLISDDHGYYVRRLAEAFDASTREAITQAIDVMERLSAELIALGRADDFQCCICDAGLQRRESIGKGMSRAKNAAELLD